MALNIMPANTKRIISMNNGSKSNFPIGCIGINSYINSVNLWINLEDEVANLQIGNYCSIAHDVTVLINRNHDYNAVTTSSIDMFNFDNKKINQKGQILIGNDVWIGNNTILLSGIKIGNGAVIGAGAVVSKDIPAYAIAVGNSIKVIKYRFNEEQRKKLQCIKWWNWDINRIERNRNWFDKNIEDFIDKFYIEPSYPSDISVNTKGTSILFYPDFAEQYPIWKKIINEYVHTFTDEDDVTLILRIPKSNDFEVKVNLISESIRTRQHLPEILVLNDIIEDERSIFKKVKYFITTRSIQMIEFIEMADEFDVKILSGVDIPIF